MPLTAKTVLANTDVRLALQQAWTDSNPGLTGGHKEGGFVLRDADGSLSVRRWQKGLQDTIQVPPHGNCIFDGLEIVASFHTHLILIQIQAMTICRNQVKPTNALSATTLN